MPRPRRLTAALTLPALCFSALFLPACTPEKEPAVKKLPAEKAYRLLADSISNPSEFPEITSAKLLSHVPGGLGSRHYRIDITAADGLSDAQLLRLTERLDTRVWVREKTLPKMIPLTLRFRYEGAAVTLPRGAERQHSWYGLTNEVFREVKPGIQRFEVTYENGSAETATCLSESQPGMPQADIAPLLAGPVPHACNRVIRIWNRAADHPLELTLNIEKGNWPTFDVRAFAGEFAKYNLHSTKIDQHGNITGMNGLVEYPGATIAEIVDHWASTLKTEATAETPLGTFRASKNEITFTPNPKSEFQGAQEKIPEVAGLFPRPRQR